MKFFYLFILFQIYLCFYQDFANIENFSDAEEAYKYLEDLYDKYENMKSGKEKDEFGRKLKDLSLKISIKFVSNEKVIKKTERLLNGLPESDFISISTNALSFLGNRNSELVEYCSRVKCNVPIEILKSSTSSNWVFSSNGFTFVGQGLAAYLKFKASYEKCKAKGKESYFLSTIQSLTKVGTNITFGSIGSYLGTLAFPGVGTLVGGFIGGLFGSKINQLYEFDC